MRRGGIYRAALKREAGAYVSESNYFDEDWQASYWGANHQRLLAAKQAYDSKAGAGDGFTRQG